MIKVIDNAILFVQDLALAEEWYRGVFGTQPVLRLGENILAFSLGGEGIDCILMEVPDRLVNIIRVQGDNLEYRLAQWSEWGDVVEKDYSAQPLGGLQVVLRDPGGNLLLMFPEPKDS